MCEQYGDPKLCHEMKRKILAGNAARANAPITTLLAEAAANDDLNWTRRVPEEWDPDD
jgi:hypothetical protein